MPSTIAVQVARAARSGRFSPSFWPTSVLTAMFRPIIGTNATALIVNAIEVAAPATRPTDATALVSSVNALPSMSCGRPLGRPNRTSRRKRSTVESDCCPGRTARVRAGRRISSQNISTVAQLEMTVVSAAPAIPICGKPQRAEDERVFQRDVEQRPRAVDEHHDARQPAAGVEARLGLGDHHGARAEREHLKVDDLQPLDLGRVPRPGKQPGRERNHQAGTAAPSPSRTRCRA